jgi:hypothetical protein
MFDGGSEMEAVAELESVTGSNPQRGESVSVHISPAREN